MANNNLRARITQDGITVSRGNESLWIPPRASPLEEFTDTTHTDAENTETNDGQQRLLGLRIEGRRVLVNGEPVPTEWADRTEDPAPPELESSLMAPCYSASGFARLLNRLGKKVSPAAVESFLRRYREKYPDCYQFTDSPRRNEPKGMYRTADVWPILKEHFSKK